MRPESRRPIRCVVCLTLILLPLLLAAAEPVDPAAAGSGELLRKDGQGFVPLPLVDMQVELRVTGIMARGTVTQTFVNPTSDVIEAIYVFPLPERAAVDAMEMRIGDRRIRAIVKEKEEAKATYETAKREGRKAGLVDQNRPNLFTTSVANINPNETIAVRLEYLEEVAYREGEFGLVFPLAFTPRYAPPASGDSILEAAQRFFVKPESAAAPRATIDVRIDPGVALEGVRSTSHAILSEPEESAWHVRPEGGPVVADRDFVLRWKPRRGDRPEGTVFVEDRDEGRYGLAMIVPPVPVGGAGQGLPTETLFIIDISGSMGGASIEQARGALLRALDRLRPGDTFDVMKFNDQNEVLSDRFLSARGDELDRARAWVRSLRASGGTEIVPALVRGMRMLADADPWPAQRLVLITDGAVANEEEAFSAVTRDLGKARLHIIGIGSAPNRYLVRQLARFGRGAFEFIDGSGEIEAHIDSFLTRIDRPVLTDLALRWEGASAAEIYPERIPDLYAGDPLFVSFRLGTGQDAGQAVLAGRTASGPVRIDLAIAPDAARGSGVATRWARAKVEALTDDLRHGADEATVRRAIVAVARSFDLVTRYTSLVAVEEFPSAHGACTTHRVAGTLPAGSTLLDGTLPQTGTAGPLRVVLGLSLLLAAALVECLRRFAA